MAAGQDPGEGQESEMDRQLRWALERWERAEEMRAMSPAELLAWHRACRERSRLEELFHQDQEEAARRELGGGTEA